MAIEIVDSPIKNGGSFHSYVSLPEGIYCIYPICTAFAWLLRALAQVLIDGYAKGAGRLLVACAPPWTWPGLMTSGAVSK